MVTYLSECNLTIIRIPIEEGRYEYYRESLYVCINLSRLVVETLETIGWHRWPRPRRRRRRIENRDWRRRRRGTDRRTDGTATV